jgi:hypothetical protein
MFSRASVIRRASGQLARLIVMETFVPGLPRRRSTASCRSMLMVDCSSIFWITSLGLIPARCAGVFLRTRTTVRFPSRIWMTKPSPPNSPRVWSFISLKYFGSSRTVCGSSVDSIPFTAAYSISFSSLCATRCSWTKPIASPSTVRIFQIESTPEMSTSRWADPTVSVSLGDFASPVTITSATVFSTDSSADTTICFGSNRAGST